jgi:hypothetical protein
VKLEGESAKNAEFNNFQKIDISKTYLPTKSIGFVAFQNPKPNYNFSVKFRNWPLFK